jgi:hypothetical protein
MPNPLYLERGDSNFLLSVHNTTFSLEQVLRTPAKYSYFSLKLNLPAQENQKAWFCSLHSMYTVKKVNDFSLPSRMSLTKLSLAENNLIIPGQGKFGK